MRYFLFICTDPRAEPSSPEQDNIEEWLAEMATRDLRVHGDRLRPVDDAITARVRIPTLVIAGGKSPAYMQNSMRGWAQVFPNAVHQTLAGQTQMVKQDVLLPELRHFFALASEPAR